MKKQKGFTLIEILIYIGIFSILLLVLTGLFNTTLSLQLESGAVSSTEQDGRFILSRLSYDITSSESIVIPANAGQQSTSLQLTKDGTTYTYSLTNGNLQIINTNGTDILNSAYTTISAMTFTRLSNPFGKPTIRVVFTVTSKIKSNVETDTKTFQATIGVR